MSHRPASFRRLGAGAVSVLAVLLLTACAAAEPKPLADSDPTPISGGVIVDEAPTTAPLAGSTEELLAEMASEMSRLSALIAGDGDQHASLDRIVMIWATIEPDVEATRAGLVNGIGTTVEMAETAVVHNQPADADKAFSVLTDLVDSYTGDG